MIVHDDPRHHLFVPVAAPLVPVRSLDQPGDIGPAVADDMGRNALGDRDHLAPDDEDAVVAPGELLFDNDAPIVLAGLLEAPAHLLRRGEADADAAAVIAVEPLCHDWI